MADETATPDSTAQAAAPAEPPPAPAEPPPAPAEPPRAAPEPHHATASAPPPQPSAPPPQHSAPAPQHTAPAPQAAAPAEHDSATAADRSGGGAPDPSAPAAHHAAAHLDAGTAAASDRAGIGDILGQIGNQPAPTVPGGAGGAAQPVTGGGAAQPVTGGGAAAAGGGPAGGDAVGAGHPGDAGTPDVVPIDAGPTGDLLNPHPGAPGNAAGPAGSEPTAATATAPANGGKITEQKGEQALSFGGSGQHGHGAAAHHVQPPVEHAVAPPPTVHAPQVVHAPSAAPPPPAQPVTHHEHHEPRVLIDPDDLLAYAKSVAHTAAEYRHVAMRLQASMAANPAEVEPETRVTRHALEALADELEAEARELEMRSGIVDELEHAPGVTDAAAVRAAFATHLRPFDVKDEK